jgi:hypothetical protein
VREYIVYYSSYDGIKNDSSVGRHESHSHVLCVPEAAEHPSMPRPGTFNRCTASNAARKVFTELTGTRLQQNSYIFAIQVSELKPTGPRL